MKVRIKKFPDPVREYGINGSFPKIRLFLGDDWKILSTCLIEKGDNGLFTVMSPGMIQNWSERYDEVITYIFGDYTLADSKNAAHFNLAQVSQESVYYNS